MEDSYLSPSLYCYYLMLPCRWVTLWDGGHRLLGSNAEMHMIMTNNEWESE